MYTTLATMAVHLKEMVSNLLTEGAGDQVVKQAMWGKGEPRWHASTLARKACWDVKHVTTQSMLARELVNTLGTLAREHVSSQDTFPREHVSTHGMGFSWLYDSRKMKNF